MGTCSLQKAVLAIEHKGSASLQTQHTWKVFWADKVCSTCTSRLLSRPAFLTHCTEGLKSLRPGFAQTEQQWQLENCCTVDMPDDWISARSDGPPLLHPLCNAPRIHVL